MVNQGIIRLLQNTCRVSGMTVVKGDRFDTMASCASYIKLKCGVMSYNHSLSVSFTSALEHSGVQERFFAILERDGIPVKKVSNTP